MKRFVTFAAILMFCSGTLSAADKPQLDGLWWSRLSPDFKLGWVSGYAQAMDQGYSFYVGSCVGNLPMYQKQFPDVDAKKLLQTMCFSNTSYDFDGITMGQFVEGVDTFFKDYRNKQLEVVWAIEYVRDEIKGKPAQELEAELTTWRRCSGAMQTGNTDQIAKACTPDDTTQKK